jgi:hypothetical protein
VLVGADDIHSAVRHVLFGPEKWHRGRRKRSRTEPRWRRASRRLTHRTYRKPCAGTRRCACRGRRAFRAIGSEQDALSPARRCSPTARDAEMARGSTDFSFNAVAWLYRVSCGEEIEAARSEQTVACAQIASWSDWVCPNCAVNRLGEGLASAASD